jgi:hypothetical protein
LDTELAAIQEREHFKRLEQQIQDMMVDRTVDYRQLCKELDDEEGGIYIITYRDSSTDRSKK